MKKHFKKILGVSLAIVVVAFSTTYFNLAKSSTVDDLSGYAWGAEDWVDTDGNGTQGTGETMTPAGGMSWLSFNCTTDTDGNCGTSNYGVNYNSTTGYITGYAWSASYGWLKFGGLSGWPTGSGTTPDNAKVIGVGNLRPVVGWARFCSAAADPVTCSGTVPNLKNGGWDGWVSLNKITAPPYGVTLNITTGAFSGYAWGGNACSGNNCGHNVVGWISFNCVDYPTCANNSGTEYHVQYTPVTGPTVSLTASATSVPVGGTTTLTWTGLNLVNNSTGCTASVGTGTPSGSGWTGSQPSPSSPSGGFTTNALSAGTYDFIITCDGSSGGTATSDVTVTVANTVLDFFAEPSAAYAPDYKTTLKWNSSSNLINCSADSAFPLNINSVPGWQSPPNVPGSPPQQSSALLYVPYNPTKFKLTCTDQASGLPVTSTVSVPRVIPTESVTLSASAVTQNPPPSGPYITNMTWTTKNVQPNSCVATNGGSNWPGNKTNPQNGSSNQTNVNVPGTPPPPLVNTTYTLTCNGLYSGKAITVSIQLNQNSSNTSATITPKYTEK